MLEKSLFMGSKFCWKLCNETFYMKKKVLWQILMRVYTKQYLSFSHGVFYSKFTAKYISIIVYTKKTVDIRKSG